MQYVPQQTESSRKSSTAGGKERRSSLTRKEFYDLAEECRRLALELARKDQHRVDLGFCHMFNGWLPQLKRYDLLARYLVDMKPARPVARWQLISLGIVVGIIALFFLPTRFSPDVSSVLLFGYLLSLIAFHFVPEKVYGTTVELLEAKLLRIVETMEKLLINEQIEFTQAAYFRVRENLRVAREELRQQLDLANRRQ